VARARLGLIALLLGCGIASRDVSVAQEFQAGGGPPTADTSFDSTSLLAPFSANVSQLKSVKLKAAVLESTDGGDLSFVSVATLTLSGNGLPEVQLAILSSTPGGRRAELAVQGHELKPYLMAGGLIAAKVTYTARPVTARGLKLTLTLHGDLL
jgi:hypothetical protein